MVLSDMINLGQRKLEEAFFLKRNQEVLENYQHKLVIEQYKSKTGIDNTELAESLMAQDIGPATLAVVELIPIVYVAWADDTLHAKERRVLLEAAKACGVISGTPEFASLEYWMDHKPGDDLLHMWELYIKEFKNRLKTPLMHDFATNLLKFIHQVADAAGVIPGLFERVSPSEARAIDRIQKILNDSMA